MTGFFHAIILFENEYNYFNEVQNDYFRHYPTTKSRFRDPFDR